MKVEREHIQENAYNEMKWNDDVLGLQRVKQLTINKRKLDGNDCEPNETEKLLSMLKLSKFDYCNYKLVLLILTTKGQWIVVDLFELNLFVCCIATTTTWNRISTQYFYVNRLVQFFVCEHRVVQSIWWSTMLLQNRWMRNVTTNCEYVSTNTSIVQMSMSPLDHDTDDQWDRDDIRIVYELKYHRKKEPRRNFN